MSDVWADLFTAEFRALNGRMDSCPGCKSLGVCGPHRAEWWALRDSEKMADRGADT